MTAGLSFEEIVAVAVPAACPLAGCVVIAALEVQRERHHIGRVLRATMAGFLALLLFVAGCLAGAHSLHRSLHGDSGGGHALCLACAIAKAQFNAVEAALIATVLLLILANPRLPSVALPNLTRFAPCRSRAPPETSSSF